PCPRLSFLLLLVAVATAARLARVLRAGPVRGERGFRRHVAALLFERGLLARREGPVRRRWDVPEERQEPRELAPAAHEVLLHDPEERRRYPVQREPRREAPRDEHREQREVVLHRLHHLLLRVDGLRLG